MRWGPGAAVLNLVTAYNGVDDAVVPAHGGTTLSMNSRAKPVMQPTLMALACSAFSKLSMAGGWIEDCLSTCEEFSAGKKCQAGYVPRMASHSRISRA